VHPGDLGLELVVAPRSCRGWAALADQYVDGANCSAVQIGSTPKRFRWASMEAITSCVDRRARSRRKSLFCSVRGSPSAVTHRDYRGERDARKQEGDRNAAIRPVDALEGVGGTGRI
jgi:hypothetical protein